jgi:hypothetical protein
MARMMRWSIGLSVGFEGGGKRRRHEQLRAYIIPLKAFLFPLRSFSYRLPAMPDRKLLKVGDLIRVIAIPPFDLAQMYDGLAKGMPDPGFTVRVIQHLKDTRKIRRVVSVDEYGNAWIEVKLRNKKHQSMEEHSLAIMDDESWEIVMLKAPAL